MARNKVQFQKRLSGSDFRAVSRARVAAVRAVSKSPPEDCFSAPAAATAARIPAFKWVNTTIADFKTARRGTYHASRAKHVPRYLAQFEYRFNRRYRLKDMITRLPWVALRTPPLPCRIIKQAEFGA